MYLGITFSGLDDPLIVGQSATISCMTSISVNSIEWTNQSSSVLNMTSGENLTMLEYTIPLVTDDLHGQQFICIAMTEDATYNGTAAVEIVVTGTHTCTCIYAVCVYSRCDCGSLVTCVYLSSPS